ncbi:MAG: radical SAM protein [Candidatus Binatia bacterium]
MGDRIGSSLSKHWRGNHVSRPFAKESQGGFDAAREFVVDERPEPSYLRLLRTRELERRVTVAVAELQACRVCPRNCAVDRLHALPPERRGDSVHLRRGGPTTKRVVPGHISKGTSCFTGRYARGASASPHFGEEDCLRGWRGSGTIFFSFCNLRCVFCQNWDVSQAGDGVEVHAEQLAALMLKLQSEGCHNINFVTPEHVVPQILEAVWLAAQGGLRLPLVYNTSGYDSLRSLQLLDGVVDIYMPDFKYWDRALARRYLKATDYPEVVCQVVREMHRQVGPLRFARDGLAVRGVLVRHLVMPGCAEDAHAIVRFLAHEVSRDTYLNVMEQYHPAGAVEERKYPELCRRPEQREIDQVIEYARAEGLWRFDHRWR